MENNWKISKSQKNVLEYLFKEISNKKIKKVLDIGSGRTSIYYLTSKFKNLKIKGMIYPGDTRKITPIIECVKNKNYELIESDIMNFNSKEKFDVILGHLFLGEAEKFGKNRFENILKKLFSINTNYLVLINLFRDKIDYNLLLKQISIKGSILKIKYGISESGDEFLGILIKIKNGK